MSITRSIEAFSATVGSGSRFAFSKARENLARNVPSCRVGCFSTTSASISRRLVSVASSSSPTCCLVAVSLSDLSLVCARSVSVAALVASSSATIASISAVSSASIMASISAVSAASIAPSMVSCSGAVASARSSAARISSNTASSVIVFGSTPRAISRSTAELIWSVLKSVSASPVSGSTVCVGRANSSPCT